MATDAPAADFALTHTVHAAEEAGIRCGPVASVDVF
jgi:hypothetical protein